MKAVTWERVRDETQADPDLCQLIEIITEGFPPNVKDLPPALHPYWIHRNDLMVLDKVVMVGERIVIPKALRGEVSDCLHAAHQGVTGMGNRARTAVY